MGDGVTPEQIEELILGLRRDMDDLRARNAQLESRVQELELRGSADLVYVAPAVPAGQVVV